MRVLLDEDVREALHHRFEDPAFDIETAGYRGFKGLSNGALLSAAVEAGFDALVTRWTRTCRTSETCAATTSA